MTTVYYLYNQQDRHLVSAFDLGLRRAHNENCPIFSLPPEILTYIFQLTLEADPSPGSVLLHGAICSKWRGVAWSSSELWSNIRIDFQYCEYVPMRRFTALDMELLTEWMLRTGTIRPLTLTVHCSAYTLRNPYVCPFIEPVQLFRFLCDHRQRWERLNLCIPPGWFKTLNNLDFPNLKIVYFRALDLSPARPRDPFAVDLGQWRAGSLWAVHMGEIQPHSVNIAWSQLRCINLTGMRPEPFFNILPHLTYAVEVHISLLWGCYRPVLAWTSRIEPVKLPALDRLSINCEVATFATAVLGKLVACNLNCLTLSLFKESMDIFPAAIHEFVAQSKLTKLTLEVDYDNSNATVLQATEMWEKLADQVLVPIELKGKWFAFEAIPF
jgi:hypothetical protein